MKEQCLSCKFWRDYYHSHGGGHGYCQRYPPKTAFDGSRIFPKTSYYIWCGDYMTVDNTEFEKRVSECGIPMDRL